jgi:periplasmic protein TonB
MAFEQFLTQDKSKPTKLRTITFSIALLLHAGLLAVGVYLSFWHVEELSPPSVSVTFLAGAPPPPPPPPPPKRKKAETKVVPKEIVQPKPSQIVQPREKPPEPEEEEDDGVEGGVEGGVAGGVVGGIVGNNAPTMLPPNIGTAQRITDVNVDPYKPRLPAALNRAGMVQWGLYKVCVTAQGDVQSVTPMKPADPLVNDDWMAKIKTWKYKPYSVNGRPVPFCSPVRVQVTAQN